MWLAACARVNPVGRSRLASAAPCVRRWPRSRSGPAGLSCGRCSQNGPQAANWAAVTCWSEPNRPRIGSGQGPAADAGAPVRQCLGEAAAAAPEDRIRPAPPGFDDPSEVCIRLGVEHADADGQRGAEHPGLGRHTGFAQMGDDVGADRRPALPGIPRVLKSVASDAALIREGGRQHRAVPWPGPPTGGEFRQRGAAQQAIDLLVRDRCAGEVDGQVGDQRGGRRRGEFPREAVERGVGRQGRREGAVPIDRHRAGETDQLGRGVERAGQVVGQEAQRGPHPGGTLYFPRCLSKKAAISPMASRTSGMRSSR